jgi:hypothetical protein
MLRLSWSSLFRKRKPFRTNPLKRMAKFMFAATDALDVINEPAYVRCMITIT